MSVSSVDSLGGVERVELLMTSRPCNECLTSKNRIVPGSRAAEIIRGCRANDIHFQCHKGTAAGQNVHCRGVFDTNGPSKAYRMARAFGIPIVEIDPSTIPQTPVNHKESDE
jgi:hypothetical protein